MAVTRTPWTTIVDGETVALGLLIAGVPWLLVPPGVSVTAVAWTADPDPAWHVGTSPTSKPWLDTSDQSPPLTIEERASPVQGTLEVSDLTFHLLDVDGAATELFGARDAMPYTILAADLGASATTITTDVPSASGVYGSSGTVHLGRERITFSGTSGANLTGCTRGTAGTRARPHRVNARDPSKHRVYGMPLGIAEALPSLVGRRVTLWLLRMTGATTAQNPTLLYDGRAMIGDGLADDGAAWELPTQHVVKVLAGKASAPAVSIYGFQHYGRGRGASVSSLQTEEENPLVVTWQAPSGGAGARMLLESNGTGADAGWHPTREGFLQDWNTLAAGLSTVLRVAEERGVLGVFAQHGSDRRLVARFGWEAGGRGLIVASPEDTDDGTTATAVYSQTAFPEACVWVAPQLPLAPGDLALIPAVPGTLSDEVFARWTLTPDKDAARAVKINAIESTYLVTEGYGWTGPITRPTVAYLGLHAEGPRWWSVLRYGVLDQVQDLRGLDHLGDSIAWDRVRAMCEANPSPVANAREYRVDLAAPLLDVLSNEARLGGYALATYRGRVALAAFREVAPTAPAAATLTTTDFRAGALAMAQNASDGLVTAYKLVAPDGDGEINIFDGAAIDESGEGETITATAPRRALPAEGVQSDALRQAVAERFGAAMAPWVRAYQLATLPLTLRHADVEIGDVVRVTEWVIPNGQGGRGLAAASGLVMGRRIDLKTGDVNLYARLSPSDLVGYAPEALVASIAGDVLTLDTVTCGAAGFASEFLADGTARADGGADTFTVGQEVQLVEIDATSPASPYTSQVAAISAATITLAGSPGASWEALAAAGRCLLTFRERAAADADQYRWAYVCDDATLVFPDGARTRRYA